MTDKNQYFEANLRPGGKGAGLRRINAETGQEDIRTREIPTGSTFARRIGKLIDFKRRKPKNTK